MNGQRQASGGDVLFYAFFHCIGVAHDAKESCNR